MKKAEPETLAGRPDAADLPRHRNRPSSGEPAQFRAGAIDPRWQPESGWDMNPNLNNFNPARWYAPPIDPTWRPRSAYKATTDVTEFNPARWYKAPIDSTWWPKDGFAAREAWFGPILPDR